MDAAFDIAYQEASAISYPIVSLLGVHRISSENVIGNNPLIFSSKEVASIFREMSQVFNLSVDNLCAIQQIVLSSLPGDISWASNVLSRSHFHDRQVCLLIDLCVSLSNALCLCIDCTIVGQTYDHMTIHKLILSNPSIPYSEKRLFVNTMVLMPLRRKQLTSPINQHSISTHANDMSIFFATCYSEIKSMRILIGAIACDFEIFL